MYFVAATTLVVPTVAFAMLSFFSRRPSNLGVVEGRLAPCPRSPNCVATQSGDEKQRMSPFPFRDSPAEAMARLKRIVRAMPRARVVTATDDYLHAEFTSALFRFVDDVEFLIDRDARAVHFRSASRAGYSDLGVNRRRMEEIRERFCQ